LIRSYFNIIFYKPGDNDAQKLPSPLKVYDRGNQSMIIKNYLMENLDTLKYPNSQKHNMSPLNIFSNKGTKG